MACFRIARVGGVTVAAAWLGGCGALVDGLLNRVYLKPPYEVGGEARDLYRRQLVIDLHGDALLWDRDILERSSRGHIDLPRLKEGNVALQVFGVVTQVPLFLGLEDNSATPDVITVLAMFDDWPPQTGASRLQRALYQADKLAGAIARSDGALTLIGDRAGLEALLAARRRGEPVIGAMLMLEGVHALEGEAANVDLLYDAGFRIIGLAHFFDNEMSGSAHGKERYGLTQEGRELVRRMQARGMIIDLAHASPQTFEDVLEIAEGPVIVSHGGVRATCDTVRNLSDAQIRAVAETGGVIGIGVFRYATCGRTVSDTLRAMRHVADLVGVRHVALGSDFDGATTTAFDTTGWPLLTEALMEDGFDDEEIAAILGGNVVRVLRQALP